MNQTKNYRHQIVILAFAAIIALFVSVGLGNSSRNTDDVDGMPTQMPMDIANALTIEDIRVDEIYCAVDPQENRSITFKVTDAPYAAGEELNSLVIPTDEGDMYAISLGLLRRGGPEFTVKGACPEG